MPGPIPKRIIGAFRTQEPVELSGLKAFAKISSPQREEAQGRILKAHASWKSELRAVQMSPAKSSIQAALRAKQAEIGAIILMLGDPIPKLQLEIDDGTLGERNLQFQSVLEDLLQLQGHTFHDYREAADRALEAARDYDRMSTKLNAAVEQTVDDGIFVEMSERGPRQKLFRAVHSILVAVLKDADLSVNALIVTVIMELEGTTFEDSEKGYAYRKQLAMQIRKAVKSDEVSELAPPQG